MQWLYKTLKLSPSITCAIVNGLVRRQTRPVEDDLTCDDEGGCPRFSRERRSHGLHKGSFAHHTCRVVAMTGPV